MYIFLMFLAVKTCKIKLLTDVPLFILRDQFGCSDCSAMAESRTEKTEGGMLFLPCGIGSHPKDDGGFSGFSSDANLAGDDEVIHMFSTEYAAVPS